MNRDIGRDRSVDPIPLGQDYIRILCIKLYGYPEQVSEQRRRRRRIGGKVIQIVVENERLQVICGCS